MYRILYEETQAEIVEKKSRFIAYLKPVHSEEEAASFIEGVKKKHWDARHNCSAIVIGRNNEFTRCSDDGEPAGTAGKPMLDVLLNEQVHDMAVVVTRYFADWSEPTRERSRQHWNRRKYWKNMLVIYWSYALIITDSGRSSILPQNREHLFWIQDIVKMS